MSDRFQDPRVALDDARRLMAEGDYEGSLAGFIWFFEQAARIDPALRGVRRSYALGYWKELGDVYPPASAALREAFAAACAAAKCSIGSEAFLDAASLAENLGTEQELFDLLQELMTDFPEVARKGYPSVCLQAVESNRHRQFCPLLADPLEVLKREASVLKHFCEKGRRSEEFDHRAWAIERFNRNCGLLRRHLDDCQRGDESVEIDTARARVLDLLPPGG